MINSIYNKNVGLELVMFRSQGIQNQVLKWVEFNLVEDFFLRHFSLIFFLVIFQALALLRSVVLASAQRNQQRSKSEIERSEELTRVEREHLSEEKSGRLSTIESTGTLGDDDLDVDLDESCSDSEDVFEHPQ